MGNSSSTPTNFSNEEVIREHMETYASHWNGNGQTELFRTHVPTGVVDFTEKYNHLGLNKVFTSEKVKTKIVFGDFNCLHLFRNSRTEVDLPIYSESGFTVLHPLGEPGRDLEDNCGSKVSHMMIIKHNDDDSDKSPITFNEMLPSVQEEVDDLELRINVGKKAYENLQRNAPLSECGDKVKEKATKMNIAHTTGIREYFGRMIMSFTPEFKSSTPGYKLFDGKNKEVSGDHQSVQMLIENTFTDPSLETCACIQPPSKNSQVLSHIHLFRIKGIPKGLDENYYDCEVVLKIKKELLTKDSRGSKAGVTSGRAVTPERGCDSSSRSKTPPRGEGSDQLSRTMTRGKTPPRGSDSPLGRSRVVTSPRSNCSDSLKRQNTRAVSPELSRMASTRSIVH